jgi:hypothetical protein
VQSVVAAENAAVAGQSVIAAESAAAAGETVAVAGNAAVLVAESAAVAGQSVNGAEGNGENSSRGVGVVEATEADQAGPSSASAAANEAGLSTVTSKERETTTASHDGLLVTPRNGDKENPTDKLAIVKEDPLDRYRRQQGLRTIDRDANAKAVTMTPDDDESKLADQDGRLTEEESNKAKAASPAAGGGIPATVATTPTAEKKAATSNVPPKGQRGRPKGSKNRRWQGNATRYALRSKPKNDDKNE